MKDGKYYWGGGKGIEETYVKMFDSIELDYKEGIYIGYRWYDKKKISPQFPFGFGLSYTSFNIDNIKSSSTKFIKSAPVDISFTISNTGKAAGAETAQLYVHPVNAQIDRPVKELKGFKKVYLQPGESKKVKIQIDSRDICYWNDKTHRWEESLGEYSIEVGTSSKDIMQKIMLSNSK